MKSSSGVRAKSTSLPRPLNRGESLARRGLRHTPTGAPCVNAFCSRRGPHRSIPLLLGSLLGTPGILSRVHHVSVEGVRHACQWWVPTARAFLQVKCFKQCTRAALDQVEKLSDWLE